MRAWFNGYKVIVPELWGNKLILLIEIYQLRFMARF